MFDDTCFHRIVRVEVPIHVVVRARITKRVVFQSDRTESPANCRRIIITRLCSMNMIIAAAMTAAQSIESEYRFIDNPSLNYSARITEVTGLLRHNLGRRFHQPVGKVHV